MMLSSYSLQNSVLCLFIQNVPRGTNDTSRGARERSSLITISGWRQRSAAKGRRSCSPRCKPWLHVVADSVPRTLMRGALRRNQRHFWYFWCQKYISGRIISAPTVHRRQSVNLFYKFINFCAESRIFFF